ncbi:HET-domain-containing protein [Cadophora sp. DSE1049]|nr:HET-domain-containing protein [Cadophora sp. DSE1049]
MGQPIDEEREEEIERGKEEAYFQWLQSGGNSSPDWRNWAATRQQSWFQGPRWFEEESRSWWRNTHADYERRHTWNSEMERRRLAWGAGDLESNIATVFSGALCKSCENLPFCRPIESLARNRAASDAFSASTRAEHCELCSIILKSLETEPVTTHLGCGPNDPAGGLTILPKLGSKPYFLLLDGWLRDCNSKHRHAMSFCTTLPTRVLDVGVPEEPNLLRLYVTGGEKGLYITLSHRWGRDDKMFSTMNKSKENNLQTRSEEIKLDKLPATFRDAVIVTRMLGVQYLWIDSLCIVQDDDEDVARECSRMGQIFSSAYCTIAVSSAKSCKEGFLHRPDERLVQLSDRGGDTSLCVRRVREDFSRDIDAAELSQRGWVFQERVLSVRTIHFTETQTYWECGLLASCETAHEIDIEPSPMTMSAFPRTRDFNERDPSLFQYTFAKYSKLDLTYWKDRPSAIAGLESILAGFYSTSSAYGILSRFFGRSLLWHRPRDKWVEPIPDFQNARVPSWSWMAYKGEISYEAIPKAGMKWERDIEFIFRESGHQAEHWCALKAPLARISAGCYIDRKDYTHCRVHNATASFIGCAIFDEKYDGEDIGRDDVDIDRLGCIVIARGKPSETYMDSSRDRELRQDDLCYILLVLQADASIPEPNPEDGSEGEETVYKRVARRDSRRYI